MKNFVLTALIFLFGTTGLSGQSAKADEIRVRADSLYKRGEYQEALAAYTQMRDLFKKSSTDSFALYQARIFKVRNKIASGNTLKEIDAFNDKYLPLVKSGRIRFMLLSEKLEFFTATWQLDDALALARTLPKKYRDWGVDDPILFSNVYKVIAFCFNMEGNLDSLEFYNLKNLEYLKQHLPPDHSEFGYANYNLGHLYSNKSETARSIYHFEKADSILSLHLDKDHPNLGILYYTIADMYRQKGRYDEANKKYQDAIRIFKAKNLDVHLIYAYNNIAGLESSLGQFGSVKLYIEEAIEIAKRNEMFAGEIKVFLLKSLAVYEADANGDFEKAIGYQKEALAEGYALGDSLNTNIAHTHFSIGYLSNFRKDTATARFHLDKAMAIHKAIGEEESNNYVNVLYEYGVLYSIQKKYREALDVFKRVLKRYLHDLGPQHGYVSTTYIDMINCYDALGQKERSDSLLLSGSAYFFADGYDQMMAIAPSNLEIFYKGLKLRFERCRTKSDYTALFAQVKKVNFSSMFKRSMAVNKEDVNLFVATSDNLYRLLMDEALKAYHVYGDKTFLKEMVAAANGLKSNLISNKLDEDRFLQSSAIDSALIEEYRLLRDRARYLELNTDAGDSLDGQSLKTLKTEVNQEISEWFSQVAQKDGSIGSKIQSGSFRDIDVQALLEVLCKRNTTLVFYSQENEGYIAYKFACRGIEKFELDSVALVQRKVKTYLNKIKKLEPISSLAQEGHQLYVSLFKPLNIKTERVIVVPDNSFSFLNFDLLIQKKPKEKATYKDVDWLIRRHEITYAQLIPEVKERNKGRDNNGFLIIAPGFEKGEGKQHFLSGGQAISSTPWTNKLAEELAAKYQARLLAGEDATLANWEEEKAHYPHIHFGTHALMDNENPLESKLLLSENENHLDFYKIFSAHIPADLVVLAACETGLGQLTESRDVFSLAQAFQYAGVRSVVQSLWKIDDESTNDIFKEFYTGYMDGDPAAESLRAAKLNFLDTQTGSTGHPYYWGGLVYISNEMSSSHPTYIIYFIIGGLVLLGLWFFIKKKVTTL